LQERTTQSREFHFGDSLGLQSVRDQLPAYRTSGQVESICPVSANVNQALCNDGLDLVDALEVTYAAPTAWRRDGPAREIEPRHNIVFRLACHQSM
jgi:hypothetical protein